MVFLFPHFSLFFLRFLFNGGFISPRCATSVLKKFTLPSALTAPMRGGQGAFEPLHRGRRAAASLAAAGRRLTASSQNGAEDGEVGQRLGRAMDGTVMGGWMENHRKTIGNWWLNGVLW